MSEHNGDRARFQKNRKRKLRHRQRVQVLMAGKRRSIRENAAPRLDSVVAQDAEAALPAGA